MTTPGIDSERLIRLIFDVLADSPRDHGRETALYQLLEAVAGIAFRQSPFATDRQEAVPFGPIGDVTLPYCRFGAIDSIDLFGVDELMLFAFYHRHKRRYRRAADMGANIGLHSIVLSRCGMKVACFEPDPVHADILRRNLELNGLSAAVDVRQQAVSDFSGESEFVRINANTTSSHLAGSKPHPYGEMDRFRVKVVDIRDVMRDFDLIKMDVEGQEKNIIQATARVHWEHTDIMLEVGTRENAAAIFEHLRGLGLHAFAQRLGWQEVRRADEMPASYKQGSLLITARADFTW